METFNDYTEPTSIKKTSKRCSSCGGILKYSPKNGKLLCDNCGSLFNIELGSIILLHDYSEKNENIQERNEWKQQNKMFKCSSCGANVILSNLEVSKSCPYCASAFVAESQAVAGVSPDGIIPFMFDKDEALESFKKGLKKKWLAPRKLKNIKSVETIKGIYIPCFSFSAKTTSSYKGRIGEYHGSGENRKIVYRNIQGTHNRQINNVIVESSSHMDQETMETIKPFDLERAVSFNNDYVLGFMAETYDQSLKNNRKVSDNLMQQIIKNEILSNYNYDTVDYLNVNTTYENVKYSYYYLPTYKMDFKYKNKNYTSYINGQTGKFGGKYPISPVKVSMIVFFILLIVAGIILLSMFTN